MVEQDKLFEVVKGWIENNSTMKGMPSEDNGPIETKPYTTYRFDSFIQVGIEERSKPDSITDLVTIKSEEEFTCEIQVYGPKAMDEARKLRDTLQLPDVQGEFFLENISAFDWQPVINITGLDETEFEERASFDIMMRVTNITENVDLGVIKNVEGTGLIEKPDGTDQTIELLVNTP